MKINLSQILKNHRGETLKHDGEDATIGLIAYSALCNLTQQEAGLGRDDRLKRGRLAQRIVMGGDSLDLKAEEITLIKQCIGANFGPWVVAVTEDMLEGTE